MLECSEDLCDVMQRYASSSSTVTIDNGSWCQAICLQTYALRKMILWGSIGSFAEGGIWHGWISGGQSSDSQKSFQRGFLIPITVLVSTRNREISLRRSSFSIIECASPREGDIATASHVPTSLCLKAIQSHPQKDNKMPNGKYQYIENEAESLVPRIQSLHRLRCWLLYWNWRQYHFPVYGWRSIDWQTPSTCKSEFPCVFAFMRRFHFASL